MAFGLALLAACAFALGTVLQQRGTLETPAGEDDPRFLIQILHRPVWVAGALMQGLGWVLQAAALDKGSLILVQSVTATSILIALPLGTRLTAQRITRRVRWGAGWMFLGMVIFLSLGSPQQGSTAPGAAEWGSTVLVSALIVGVLAQQAIHRSGAVRALLFGSGAGVCYAFQAAVTKVFVPLIGDGLNAVLSSWTTYALIASALLGFFLQQSALKTGVLAPATASSNVVTLLGSVLLGVTVYGEALAAGDSRRLPAVLGLGITLLGMGLLAGATTATEGAADHETASRIAEETQYGRMGHDKRHDRAAERGTTSADRERRRHPDGRDH